MNTDIISSKNDIEDIKGPLKIDVKLNLVNIAICRRKL